MKPSHETHRRFGRDVCQILDASKRGISWPDNVGPEVTFIYNSGNVPIVVAVPLTRAPADVRVRRAQQIGSGYVEHGNSIQCRWEAGTLVVSSIRDLEPDEDYEIALGLERSNG